MAVPAEYVDDFLAGEIAEIVSVGLIQAKGDPRPLEPMHCTRCEHGPMQYTFAPHSRLSNGRLVLVAGMWAFRCATPGCPTSNIVLPNVRAELRQKLIDAPSYTPTHSPSHSPVPALNGHRSA